MNPANGMKYLVALPSWSWFGWYTQLTGPVYNQEEAAKRLPFPGSWNVRWMTQWFRLDIDGGLAPIEEKGSLHFAKFLRGMHGLAPIEEKGSLHFVKFLRGMHNLSCPSPTRVSPEVISITYSSYVQNLKLRATHYYH
jgi:hypothetical protein